MAACSRVTCLTNKSRTYLYKSAKLCSNTAAVKSASGQNEIIVPYKIKRGPTDLLKALASTISKDYTAPQYKYEDDPYLIPISNVTKRSFALSKESGKKAARYFLENYSDVFKCNKSDPHIKAFDPPVIYTEDDAVTVETLKDCIRDFDVKNCITVYQNLKKKEISVSQEIKQDLLELLCFYNNIPPPSDDYYEERFYSRPNEKQNEKWKAKGMAEILFQEMEKDGKAYSAMIAGASKFRAAVRAETLYGEMRSKELKGTVEAYNGLLTVLPLLQEVGDTRWEYAMRILSHMSSDGVQPNLHTMNALLAILSRSTKWNKSRAIALKVLAEMKNLKIDPSLGTYHYILMIFYGDEPRIPNIIYEVMNQVRGQEFTVRHPNDVNFFATAMEMCWKAVGDKELAYQLHNLLEYKNNCKLLGNALSEAQYFKSFFRLLSETEDMDKVMEVYDKYVPNTYTPEPSVTFSILQAIHFSGAYKYLPRFASDVLVFEQSDRENILALLTEAAATMKHEDQIQTQLIEMIWLIVEKINFRSANRRIFFNWSGIILGNILKTFLDGKDFEKSWLIIKQLREEEQNIIGYPEKDCLLNFCELCLEMKEFEKARFCLKYAVKSAYPEFQDDFKKLADKIFETEMLDAKYRPYVDEILHQNASVDEDTSSSYSVTSDESSSSSDSSSSDDDSDNDNGEEDKTSNV